MSRGVHDDRVLITSAALPPLRRPEPVLHTHQPEHEGVVRGVGEFRFVSVESCLAKQIDAARVRLPDTGSQRSLEQERPETGVPGETVVEIERADLELFVPWHAVGKWSL